MDPETRVTAPPGARRAPPEVGASRALDAQTAEAYRRAADFVRQLALGHRTAAPSSPEAAGPTPARPATTDADAGGEAAPPLTLLKGA